jgi:hypothetical protein
MGHVPTLPMPTDAWDEHGHLVTDAVFRHFSPRLSAARAGFKVAMDKHVDPVLREATRLHNARTLNCEH